jgi:hypothetical protein
MAKFIAAMRMFLAFIFGLLVGVLSVVGALYFYPDVTDSFVAKSPNVQAMRRDLESVVSQRDEMTRRLEKVTALLEQVEKRYADLGQRFEAIEAGLKRQQGARPAQQPRAGAGMTPPP